MDGTLGSQTAWMLDGSGVVITSGEELAEIIRARRAAGWPVGRARDRRPGQPRGARRVRGDARRLGSRSGCAIASSTRSASRPRTSAASPRSASPARCSSRTRPPTAISPSASGPDASDGAYAFRSLLGLGRGRGQRLGCAGRGARSARRHPRRRPAHDRRPARPGDPEQALTVEQALLASTVTPAWLAGDERTSRPAPAGLPRRPRRPLPRSARRARPTSSSRSRSSRRWSAAAGCTTRRPGSSPCAARASDPLARIPARRLAARLSYGVRSAAATRARRESSSGRRAARADPRLGAVDGAGSSQRRARAAALWCTTGSKPRRLRRGSQPDSTRGGEARVAAGVTTIRGRKSQARGTRHAGRGAGRRPFAVARTMRPWPQPTSARCSGARGADVLGRRRRRDRRREVDGAASSTTSPRARAASPSSSTRAPGSARGRSPSGCAGSSPRRSSCGRATRSRRRGSSTR